MKRTKPIILVITLFVILSALAAVPAAALTEDEVQQQIAAEGSAAVTGNIFYLVSLRLLSFRKGRYPKGGLAL